MVDVPYRINTDNVLSQPAGLTPNIVPAGGLTPENIPVSSPVQPVSPQIQPIEPVPGPQVPPPQAAAVEQSIASYPQASSINLGQPTDQTVVYAGFGRRFLATIIDGFVVGLVEFAIMFVTGFIFGLVNLTGLGIMLGYILVLIVVLGYYIGFLVKKGATLGKMAMGLKVITVSGEPLTAGRVFLREIVGKFVSAIALYIGFLSILWDPKKQGWHDKIAGTLVVKAS